MDRFALYYAPQPGSPLFAAAATWLGRDNVSFDYDQLSPDGLSSERFHELTRAPFHYGFHGTLKPPFSLRSSVDEKQIFTELKSFCKDRRRFGIGPLEVGWIGSFLCLQPMQPVRQLNSLAGDTVQQFDRFRREMSGEELARRREAGLSPHQDQLLQQWGYPYVMEEFRFHLTLSSKVASPDERKHLEAAAKKHFPPSILSEVAVDGISLFLEQYGKPMKQLQFFEFGD